MKLLKEWIGFGATQEQIKESLEKNHGILKLKGVIQRADAENQNGRIYPRDILLREIENYKKLVVERRAHGELDHSNEPVVELKNVSHIITDIWMEDNGDVIGEVEVLKTPMGNILRTYIESNVTVGISSRALGSVTNNGRVDVVEDDLHFICWDFVSEPSTHGAFMFKESKEYDTKILNKIFSREDRIDRSLNELLDLDKVIRGEKS
jgi:hypothetical protein